MSALNPVNVPEVRTVEWVMGAKSPCSRLQESRLSELLSWAGIEPADFFGSGFVSISDLSSWAAHWAIDVLEAHEEAKTIEEAREAWLDEKERRLKAAMGVILREKLRSNRGY